jgi:hypothetical protein
MRFAAVLLSAVLTAFALNTPLEAKQAAAAVSLEGVWKGSGIVRYSGKADAVVCRVRYKKVTAKSFDYTATCAITDAKYELTGRVVSTGGGRYAGTVPSEQGKETGRVRLIQSGKRLSISVTGARGSASLTLGKLT